MVVALGEDGFLKGGIGGHIDIAFVGKDPLSMLPVREMGAEGRGNGSIH